MSEELSAARKGLSERDSLVAKLRLEVLQTANKIVNVKVKRAGCCSELLKMRF